MINVLVLLIFVGKTLNASLRFNNIYPEIGRTKHRDNYIIGVEIDSQYQNSSRLRILFPEEFEMWKKNKLKAFIWNPDTRQPEATVENLALEVEREISFDFSSPWTGWIKIEGVVNPAFGGYLGDFQARLDDREGQSLDVCASKQKHGQKVYLQESQAEIEITQANKVFVPGFYTSEFNITIYNWTIYPVEIVPFCDNSQIEVVPPNIIFYPHMYTKKIGGQVLSFRLKIGATVEEGDYRLIFKKSEYNLSGISNFKKIPMINFRIQNPPCTLCSSPPKEFDGERPSIGFLFTHQYVPFEGTSLPTSVVLSHRTAEPIIINLKVARPAQYDVVRLLNDTLVIQPGDDYANFNIELTYGAVSGHVDLFIQNPIYKKLLLVKEKTLSLEVMDYERELPTVELIETEFTTSEKSDGSSELQPSIELLDFYRDSAKISKLLSYSTKADILRPEKRFSSVQNGTPYRFDSGGKINIGLSGEVNLYSIILLYPFKRFPDQARLQQMIRDFDKSSSHQIIRFDEEGVLIVRKTKNSFRNYIFITEFDLSGLGISFHLENKILIAIEDRSHRLGLLNIEVSTKDKSKAFY